MIMTQSTRIETILPFYLKGTTVKIPESRVRIGAKAYPAPCVIDAINYMYPNLYGRVYCEGPPCEAIDTFELVQHIREYMRRVSKDVTYDMSYADDALSFNDACTIRWLHGGSSSFTLLMRNESGLFVRKVAVRSGVEGNGSEKLIREHSYVQNTHLAEYYLPVSELTIDNGLNRVYCDMPFYEGGDMAAALINGFDTDILFSFLETLFTSGFCGSYKSLAISESRNSFYSNYTHRFENRINPILDHIEFKSLLKKGSIHINGKRYANPAIIMREISTSPGLFEIFKQRVSVPCIHGDLTLLNMVANDKNDIKLIDPRGYAGGFDPLYDLGKLMFSSSGFSSIIKGHVKSRQRNGVFYVSIYDDRELTAFRSQLMDFIRNNKSLDMMRALEPYFEQRVLLFEAIHYFADVLFRYHTDKGIENALSCFLIGTIKLNDLYASVKGKEAAWL